MNKMILSFVLVASVLSLTSLASAKTSKLVRSAHIYQCQTTFVLGGTITTCR